MRLQLAMFNGRERVPNLFFCIDCRAEIIRLCYFYSHTKLQLDWINIVATQVSLSSSLWEPPKRRQYKSLHKVRGTLIVLPGFFYQYHYSNQLTVDICNGLTMKLSPLIGDSFVRIHKTVKMNK